VPVIKVRPSGLRATAQTCLEAAEVLGQRRRTGVPAARLLFQAFQTDGFQVARHLRLQA
jgi:hypothetical protein